MAGHRDDGSSAERREHDPNRRVERPWRAMRPWIPMNKRPQNNPTPSSSENGHEQGTRIGKSMADLIKQMVYDAEFNDIVGLPNDYVAGPEDK